ncbi:MAG: hypothetical protein Q9M94_04045 [Candidatus Gracilibacteria bacterium]|nr:hypothetical protein [Candidatus Gracilibacteria bacterium]MDQ7023354.1 hypothetical protein [Candidatus Gracilibacteria bacterium]
MKFIVKKLGGENAAQLHNSAHNIYDDFIKGKNQAIVVSAMRNPEFNTTDKLILLGKELGKKEINEKLVFEIINNIKIFHLNLLECEMLCSKDKLKNIIEILFDNLENNIRYFINKSTESFNSLFFPEKNNDYSIELENGEKLSIIGFGEKVSAKIISGVIDTMSLKSICSKSIDLGNIISDIDLENKSRKEVFDMLTLKLSDIVIEKNKGGNIPVLSGYIGSFPEGIEERIGRGYSDATAAITAVGLARKGYGVIIEIQ